MLSKKHVIFIFAVFLFIKNTKIKNNLNKILHTVDSKCLIKQIYSLRSHSLNRFPINWNMLHSIFTKQSLCLLNNWCIIPTYINLGQTALESTLFDCIYDLREIRKVFLVIEFLNESFITIDTQTLGVVFDLGPKVQSILEVETTSIKYNLLCVAGSRDELLQVCCAEFETSHINLFRDNTDYLRKRVNVKACIYITTSTFNREESEFSRNAVVEESIEVCTFFWRIVNVESLEVGKFVREEHKVFKQV